MIRNLANNIIVGASQASQYTFLKFIITLQNSTSISSIGDLCFENPKKLCLITNRDGKK